MCKAIVAVAIAAVAVAAIIGCESMGGGTRKANIATVIHTTYDLLISPERDSPAPQASGCPNERSK